MRASARTADIVLEGTRVRLCPAREQDWTAWARVRGANQTVLKAFEPRWAPDALSENFFKRRVEVFRNEWKSGTRVSFLIWLKAAAGTTRLIGGFNLNNVCRGAGQNADLGYWLDHAAQGQGFMAEAATLACDFAFGPFGLHRLHAGTLPHNTRSQALLRRLGFVEEGFARSYIEIDGRWQDHVLFGLVEDDWRVLRRGAFS